MQNEQTSNNKLTTKKSSFSSKLGLVMAAVGGAVGLGNIWKFPYIAGDNGGGAFLIVYLICVLLFGTPLLITEFIIGKQSGRSIYGAFSSISGNKRWQWLSWSCLAATILVTGFYLMVTGWCISYLIDAISGSLVQTEDLTSHFADLSSNSGLLLLYSVIGILLTGSILWFDINKGIERLSKILMPLLFIMMIIMAIRVLMLPDSGIGLKFFFQADFSKITPRIVLAAMGQCFFSLSIGFGALITYGAYMPKDQDIIVTSTQVVILDTLVAVLAGVIIFPAVFAFGLNPAEGPQLVFVVLPSVFAKMHMARLSGIIFFSLLCIAAITSILLLLEIIIAFITDSTSHRKHPINRHKAVVITSIGIFIVCALCILSVCGTPSWLKIAGKNLFEWYDMTTSTFLMPINALATSLFLGWFVPKTIIQQSLATSPFGKSKYGQQLFLFLVRYLVPFFIVAIFINGIIQLGA